MSFHLRLEKLSAEKRLLLSHWLNNNENQAKPALAGTGEQTTDARQQLVAYITSSESTNDEELRQYLKSSLPEFMIPDVIVTLESLPRLPNGKLNRRALPKATRKNSADANTSCAPYTQTEKILAEIWAELLYMDQPGLHDNFFEFGGDSILSIQMISRAHDAGLRIEPKQVAQFPTIAGLSSQLAAEETIVKHSEKIAVGEAPATPIQQWFLNRKLDNHDHWNQTQLLALDERIKTSALKQAVGLLVDSHDALRSRFEARDDLWWQIISKSTDDTNLEVIYTESLDDESFQTALNKLQTSLDLTTGPLVRFVQLHLTSRNQHYLLIIAHHLVVDNISWSIIIEDLDHLLDQQVTDRGTAVKTKTTPIIEWSQHLTQYADGPDCKRSAEHWLALDVSGHITLPIDRSPVRPPEEASARIIVRAIGEERTQLLNDNVNRTYNTRTLDILMTALALTLQDWTGKSGIIIDLEGHGRESFDGTDLSRTVGWLTSYFPVGFDLTAINGYADAIKYVKEQLRMLPNNGLNYGLLRYLGSDGDLQRKLASLTGASVLFNFSGTGKPLKNNCNFQVMEPLDEHSRHPLNPRSHVLEINASSGESGLTLNWIYSDQLHKESTIATLADRFNQILNELIDHCSSKESGGYTPSDFPDVKLNQNELDALLDELGQQK